MWLGARFIQGPEELPKLLDLLLQTHCTRLIHDNAKWLAGEALELRKEEKALEKCQKRKDEEAESAHAQQMLEKINKKRNR